MDRFSVACVSLLAAMLLLAAGSRADATDSAFETISAGGSHSCAIRGGGELLCWGDDSAGQLEGIPTGSFRAVSAGGTHTCAISVGNELACWGDNTAGQLDEVPVGTFLTVSAGGAHTCAIRTNRELACWGDDSREQLDDIPEGTFLSVAAGDAHTCAIRTNQELVCWGDDAAGQTSGAPTYYHHHRHFHHFYFFFFFHHHSSPPKFIAVAAGDAHTCAVETDNDLRCWGDDTSGQLEEVPAGEFADVSAGGAHSCAIRTDGELACWGDDSFGQLEEVPAGPFLSVSAGGSHSCAVGDGGARTCWGSNASGQVRPTMIETELADATVGTAYAHQLETTAQMPSPDFHLAGGELPDGLTLGSDGKLSGKPAEAGSFELTVAAANGVTPDAVLEATLKVGEAPAAPMAQVKSIAATDPGLPDPVEGESFNLDPVNGVVRVKCSSKDRPRRIAVPTQISLKCKVDTRHGTGNLTTSKGNGRGTQSAQFWGGFFSVDQEAAHDWETELRLAGPLKCEKRKSGNGRVSRRSLKKGRKGRGRKLWGSGSGSYSTSGSYGSATVRGTTWLVADRCDNATLIAVRDGTVWVKDFVTGDTPILRAGDTYIARAAIPRLR